MAQVFKRMIYKNKTYELKKLDGSWIQVVVDGTDVSKVINEEEARRVIWLGLIAQGDSIKFVTDDMFESVQNVQ